MQSRQYAFLATVMLALTGCGSKTEEPAALVYSGHPVKHWLTQAHSKVLKERKHAVEVLSNVGTQHPEAIPALAEALRDADASIRDAAVLGLSKIGPPAASAISALEALLKDPNNRVRDHAKVALARIQAKD